ncbi:AraC family transcriptional regulator [Cronobacter dublinensis]
MDTLSDILELLSAKSYITSGMCTPVPWGAAYDGFDGLKFFTVQKGKVWLKTQLDESWRLLHTGDSVILTRFQPFCVATSPDTECPDAKTLNPIFMEGMANYGGDELIVIAGKMEIDYMSAGLLTGTLPPVMYLSPLPGNTSQMGFLMDYLRHEKLAPRPGSDVVTNHLMHLLMVEVLRDWFSDPSHPAQGWMGAFRDPRLMRALNLMHATPDKSWQISELANLVGMSRAGFIRRFSLLIGTTPMRYLTDWRMRLACKALRETRFPIKQIALDLGYGSESAFSTAFRRFHGDSASAFRKKVT